MIYYKVPATSANIGPGFDCFGMSLDLYNYIGLELSPKLDIKVEGIMSNTIPLNEKNMAYTTADFFFKKIGFKYDSLKIRIKNEIPISRGLGSSSSIIIGTLLCANEIAGSPFTKLQILEIANEIEGHPDNITPALFGGFTLAAKIDKDLIYRKIDLPDDLKALVFIPPYQISTNEARKILPDSYKRQDAIFNTSMASFIIYSLIKKDYSLLSKTVKDRIHQPYRKELIKEYENIQYISKQLGAIATFISGSGSTMLSIIENKNSKNILENTKKYFQQNNINIEIKLLDFINSGAKKINAL